MSDEFLDRLDRAGQAQMDWEDGRAEHQLAVEEGAARRAFPLWEIDGWTGEGKLLIHVTGMGALLLSEDQATSFANAILSEVEMRAQR